MENNRYLKPRAGLDCLLRSNRHISTELPAGLHAAATLHWSKHTPMRLDHLQPVGETHAKQCSCHDRLWEICGCLHDIFTVLSAQQLLTVDPQLQMSPGFLCTQLKVSLYVRVQWYLTRLEHLYFVIIMSGYNETSKEVKAILSYQTALS